ncbi:MAG: transglutaminase domain-containing protein, partial [Candidatus Sumerlaeota bacterium]
SHCEYFATGAAIYLRLAGVPCRYVTGFVVREKSPLQDVWTARNKDAHGWVEAWDKEEQEWRLVEATPPEGIPDGNDSSLAQPGQWWESLQILISRIKEAIHDGTLKHYLNRILASIMLALTSVQAMTLLVILALLIPIWLYLISRRQTKTASKDKDSMLDQAHDYLKRADKWLARRNLERRRNETLHHFALRLEKSEAASEGAASLAEWYRLYAGVRYNGTISKDDIRTLKQAWEASEAALKQSRTHVD